MQKPTPPHTLLPVTWDLPQKLRDRLGSRVGRQRAMAADGHLLLVMHVPPGAEESERVGRFFWRSPEGVWKSNDLGDGIGALERHLDSYADRIAKLDRAEEQAQSASDYFDVLEALLPLQRAARNSHQVLQEARKLHPEYRDIIDLRDRAYGIERNAELLFNGTQHALDFTIARRGEDQARASERMAAAAHRLNVLAAIFFPIVTLTAILGVDMLTLATLCGLDRETAIKQGVAPLIYLVMILVSAILGTVLMIFVTRPLRLPERQNGGGLQKTVGALRKKP